MNKPNICVFCNYKASRILECKHSACENCLQYAINEDRIFCPIDNVIILKDKNIDNMFKEYCCDSMFGL